VSEWDKAKEYLLFYAKDDSIIKRRDIRNQLNDAVAEGDILQKDLVFLQEACAEIQIYKDGLYDKLQEMRNLTEEMNYGDDVEEHWRKRILEVLNDK